ncbi:DNA polymerase IV [Clostridium sp. AM58-1XD]|nr:DNA polymerase IV [Clostridium sp. AM58-1XD]RGZ01778.1 DNA polymerase IV [Clostridium sp. AM58-1XD]
MERVIFHVDVNSAFLSWEAVHRLKNLGGKLDLREIPSAVAGDMSKRHGIILAKSIPAKRYGIKTGQAVWEAFQKCPDLVTAPPNYGLYEAASNAMMEIFKRYSPDVEQYSIDEAFIDMTGTKELWGEPEAAANRIREQVKQELGFTVNIGVSSNKLLAKMASDFKKPDMVHTLFPEEMKQKMWPLPVSELFFVGRATTKKLFSMGIRTIGDLAVTEPQILRQHLKSHGEVIWNFVNGMDVSLVQTEAPPNKGYGNSTTVAFDVEDERTAKLVLLALAETVGTRLRQDGVKAEVISVGIRTFDLGYSSHQKVLGNATNITNEIHQTACCLFDELWDGTPIRHLGIHTSRMRDQDTPRQMELFDENDYERLEQMDGTVDRIRGRFGNDCLKRAVFAGSPLDHMEGGISREKRNVDYSRLKIE